MSAPPDTGSPASRVAQTVVDSPDLLLGYFDAVYEAVQAYLATVADEDLDRVIDTSYTPAVTLGVRLVSFLSDSLQHAGQAMFVRGMLPN